VGLFSFVGKAIKGVAKLAGGALKVGGALGLIPGGGLAGKALGLLSHKGSGTTNMKYSTAASGGALALRGKSSPLYNIASRVVPLLGAPGISRPVMPIRSLQLSPVMPGGAVATSQGIMAPGGGVPPATFGGRTGGTTRRRKSSSSRKRSTARSGKRRSGGGRKTRKLKFGSAAYRKKYLGHKR
jgi:hypothetical protein